MTNFELFQSIYNCFIKSKGDLCRKLEFKTSENSGAVLIDSFDEKGNLLSSSSYPINILEANKLLDSLEFHNSPFNKDISRCILVKSGASSLSILRRLSTNIQSGRIELEVSSYTSSTSLEKELGFSEELIATLAQSISSSNGLIICNGKQVETRLTLQCLYPAWTHISIEEYRSNSEISKAFVYLQDYDPISLVTSFLEVGTEKDTRVALSERITAVISLIPLKKQCGACAKPTPIPQSSRSQFPFYLVDQVPTSYLFSRGCERCEYRSYKGLTFLESFFDNRGNFLKDLVDGLNPTSIFAKVRTNGFKIFHESGLEKIKNGLTSLEQTLEHTPPLEQAFDEYLNSTPHIATPSNVAQSNTEKSILIVEDDTDQREILKLVFAKEGFKVFTADNGKSALDVLGQHKVSVVLSDIMMPVMNGLQLVRNLKNDNQYKNIPVLMLTASSNPDHEVKLLEEGADDYCAKNVKKKVLLTRVEKLIEKFNSSSKDLNHFLTE